MKIQTNFLKTLAIALSLPGTFIPASAKYYGTAYTREVNGVWYARATDDGRPGDQTTNAPWKVIQRQLGNSMLYEGDLGQQQNPVEMLKNYPSEKYF